MGRDKDRIRVGDTVQVLVPRFVERVGYPKCVEDYLKEFQSNLRFQDALDKLLVLATGSTYKYPSGMKDVGPDRHRTRERIERDVAYLMAKSRRFGGSKRSIHWNEMPDFEGVEVVVRKLRSAYTGTYFPPGDGRWMPGVEDYDHDPGGLSDSKCHRLATVSLKKPVATRTSILSGDRFEIPVYHLKLVQQATPEEREKINRWEAA